MKTLRQSIIQRLESVGYVRTKHKHNTFTKEIENNLIAKVSFSIKENKRASYEVELHHDNVNISSDVVHDINEAFFTVKLRTDEFYYDKQKNIDKIVHTKKAAIKKDLLQNEFIQASDEIDLYKKGFHDYLSRYDFHVKVVYCYSKYIQFAFVPTFSFRCDFFIDNKLHSSNTFYDVNDVIDAFHSCHREHSSYEVHGFNNLLLAEHEALVFREKYNNIKKLELQVHPSNSIDYLDLLDEYITQPELDYTIFLKMTTASKRVYVMVSVHDDIPATHITVNVPEAWLINFSYTTELNNGTIILGTHHDIKTLIDTIYNKHHRPILDEIYKDNFSLDQEEELDFENIFKSENT